MNSSEGAVAGANPPSAAAPFPIAAGHAPADLRTADPRTADPRTADPRTAERMRTGALARVHPELLALALLAGLLNFWDLTRNGWANTYYAAAVRSMSGSWRDFLFASFDPGGVMTVDKPPLALWVQALSARIFGFHSLAILAPQALMGIASVLLVYDLTRRRFGRPAGFVAGLVLALTPITVAISRHNNPDALLILCCVAALWCALRALEDDRTRWFVLAGICVGLGFETKMLIALVVVPGIAAAWLWMLGQPPGRGSRTGEPAAPGFPAAPVSRSMFGGLAARGSRLGTPAAPGSIFTPGSIPNLGRDRVRARVRAHDHAAKETSTNVPCADARPVAVSARADATPLAVSGTSAAAGLARRLLAAGAALVLVAGAWPALVELDAHRRPALDLGHRRQHGAVADLRLQRPWAP